jgi:hypothetical protein
MVDPKDFKGLHEFVREVYEYYLESGYLDNSQLTISQAMVRFALSHCKERNASKLLNSMTARGYILRSDVNITFSSSFCTAPIGEAPLSIESE